MAKIEKRDLPRWSLDDYRADKCELKDVGEIMPQTDTETADIPPPPVDISKLNDMDAQLAFQEAFGALGGTQGLALWAKSNPTEFYKLYARLHAREQVGQSAPSIIINLGDTLGRIVEINRTTGKTYEN